MHSDALKYICVFATASPSRTDRPCC